MNIPTTAEEAVNWSMQGQRRESPPKRTLTALMF